jgi:hypothetical protein
MLDRDGKECFENCMSYQSLNTFSPAIKFRIVKNITIHPEGEPRHLWPLVVHSPLEKDHGAVSEMLG